VVGAFVRHGLAASEKVVYVGDAGPDELAGALHRANPSSRVHDGRLCVIPRERACLNGGRLDPDRMLGTLQHEINVAVEDGYRAVRFTTDLSWALHEPGGGKFIVDCEDRLEEAVASSVMVMVICQINPNMCSPDQLMTLTHTHEVHVTADPEYDDGILRITKTFDPYGLRLHGELDKPRHAVFAQTLGSVTGTRRPVHLDFTGLRFVDLGALSLLAAQAVARPTGQEFVLDNLPAHLHEMIETLGWHRFPGLSLGQPAW